MPMKIPARRKHIHTRDIRCHGFQREDGLWDIEATLVDTKTYSFDNEDRGGVAAGEPIHGMHIRLTVDEDLVVREAEATVSASPFAICGDIAVRYDPDPEGPRHRPRLDKVRQTAPGANSGLHAPDGNAVGAVGLGRLSDRFGAKEGQRSRG